MPTHMIVALCAIPLAISGVVTLSVCIVGSRLSRWEESRHHDHVPVEVTYHDAPQPLVASELTLNNHPIPGRYIHSWLDSAEYE